MEVLAEVFVRYWEEVIVAVLLTVTLPFIRKYVRRQRAKMINLFKEKERLQEALRKAEELAESERKAREELERNFGAGTNGNEVEKLLATLQKPEESDSLISGLAKVAALPITSKASALLGWLNKKG